MSEYTFCFEFAVYMEEPLLPYSQYGKRGSYNSLK